MSVGSRPPSASSSQTPSPSSEISVTTPPSEDRRTPELATSRGPPGPSPKPDSGRVAACPAILHPLSAGPAPSASRTSVPGGPCADQAIADPPLPSSSRQQRTETPPVQRTKSTSELPCHDAEMRCPPEGRTPTENPPSGSRMPASLSRESNLGAHQNWHSPSEETRAAVIPSLKQKWDEIGWEEGLSLTPSKVRACSEAASAGERLQQVPYLRDLLRPAGVGRVIHIHSGRGGAVVEGAGRHLARLSWIVGD